MELMDLPVEILRHIAGDVFSKWDRASLCLTCKYNNAVVGEFLWRDMTVFEGKAKGFFEVLDGPGDYAGWIRTLKFSDGWPAEREYQVETAPNSELCALFAKVLRKMPELQSLDIPMLLCGPAVIAELCAHKESKLQSLCMAIGEMDDTEDLSVLSNLELSTGKLRTLRLLECEQEYPQRFADAVSRIMQASAETIYTLDICSTLYVQQFFKGVKGFPTLLNLDIRDTDLIRLACFISKARWIRFLTVVCNGNTLDPNTANCVALYFGSFDNLHLLLQIHPYDVSRLALCTVIEFLLLSVRSKDSWNWVHRLSHYVQVSRSSRSRYIRTRKCMKRNTQATVNWAENGLRIMLKVAKEWSTTTKEWRKIRERRE